MLDSNGELILNKKEFDLNQFINRIEKIIINQLKSPNVIFRLNRDPELPDKLYTDPEKLEQILLNLLLNSQKFTQKGWIKFKI
jgi:signal transduction histidine kinase